MLKVLSAIFIVAVVALTFVQVNQWSFARNFLDGYWHIGDNEYLLIDDRIVQFVRFEESGVIVQLYKDADAAINYRSVLAFSRHDFEVNLHSDERPPGIPKRMRFELYPVAGVVRAVQHNGIELMRAVIDNAMTIVHHTI